MRYEDECNLNLDKRATDKYKDILSIIQKECDKFVFIVNSEKAKDELDRRRIEENIKQSPMFKDLAPFFIISKLCRKYSTEIKRKRGRKGYVLTDNWYYFKCTKESIKILKENTIILQTIAHEDMCYGSKELFFMITRK